MTATVSLVRIQDQLDFSGSLTPGYFLKWNGSAFVLDAVSVPSAANPSASVGLAAVNGSASTFLRSDAAPALSQSITPTWTGAHVWQVSSSGAVVVGPNGDTNPVLRVVTNVASQATGLSVTGNAAGSGVTLTVLSSGTDENLILKPKGSGSVRTYGDGAGNITLHNWYYDSGSTSVASLTSFGSFGVSGSIVGGGNNATQVGSNYLITSAGLVIVKSSGGFLFGSGGANGAVDAALYRNAAAAVEISNGSAGQWGSLLCGTRDTSTTAVTNGLTVGHQASSGTPAAGMGTAVRLRINSSTTADQDAGRLKALWADATHATRSADLVLTAYYTSTEREGVRIRGGSSDVQLGFYGVTPVSRATTGIAEASFTENAGGTAVNVDSTFGGYTLQQVVQALQNIGVLT